MSLPAQKGASLPPQAHGEDLRTQAAVLWKYTGNWSAVSRQTGIARSTLLAWSKTDWWQELQDDLIAEGRAKLTGKLATLVDKALVELEDRLTNGDWVYDQKEGKLTRKPINADVANRILQDSVSRTIEVDKLQSAGAKRENEEKIADRLVKLAQEFAKFTNSKTIQGHADVIDVSQ